MMIMVSPGPDLDEPIYGLLPRTAAGRRAVSVLRSAGIETLADLLFVTGGDLLRVRQFGAGGLEAVREGLAARGLVLLDELDPDEIGEDKPGENPPDARTLPARNDPDSSPEH